MREICRFIIKGYYYVIYEVDRIEGKETFIGESDYTNKTIKLEKSNARQMRLTLIHELLHVWLYENGIKNQEDGCFTFEDVCEIAAYSNDFINYALEVYDYWKDR